MKYIVFDCDGTLVDTSTRDYSLFPGIRELVVELAAVHQLYVWTARDRISTLRILQENGIYSYFEGLATVSDAPPKPHIGGLQSLLNGVAKEAICVIGDSSNDIFGAKLFGVTAIGAAWSPQTNGSNLKDAGADFIVSHPSECSKLVEQNLKGDPHVRQS